MLTTVSENPTIAHEALFAFAVLQASDNAEIGYSDTNQIQIDGQSWLPPVSLSEAEIEARIRFLAGDLNISKPDMHEWFQSCQVVLRQGGCSRATLIEKLLTQQKLSQTTKTTTLSWWFEALFHRLGNIDPDFKMEFGEESELLLAWSKELLESHHWSHVESPWIGIPPMPIDSAWVEPHLVQAFTDGRYRLDGVGGGQKPIRKTHFGPSGQPLISVLERLERCVVLIGAPGGGKTLALRWFSRYLLHQPQQNARFLFPIYIPLREYAQTQDEKVGLIPFFLDKFQLPQLERQYWESLMTLTKGHVSRANQVSNPFVLLLDGWDEVPAQQREEILVEINNLRHLPIIITSRPIVEVQRLGAEGYHWIEGLDRPSRVLLTQKCCSWQGNPKLSKVILDHLDANESLAELASNPFVLTLMCSIGVNQRRDRLPKTRHELYDHTVNGIVKNHDGRFPSYPFTDKLRESLERFSAWLLGEAKDAPRYVFEDAEMRSFDGITDEIFTHCIEPSRLTTRLPEKDHMRQFLHATLQEFLAAGHVLLHTEIDWASRLNDPSWTEVLRFAAGRSTPVHKKFWNALRDLIKKPDRFGMMYLHLSMLLKEVNTADGGAFLLGEDLRPLLWDKVLRFPTLQKRNAVFIKALLQFDLAWLAKEIKSSNNHQIIEMILYPAMGWLQGTPSASALSAILNGETSINPKVSYIVPRNLKQYINVLDDLSADPLERYEAMEIVATARENRAIPKLLNVIKQETGELFNKALWTLVDIGSTQAINALLNLLGPEPCQEAAFIVALGMCSDERTRDRLLNDLARLDPHHPIVIDVLTALDDKAIWRGAEIVASFIKPIFPIEIREAAIRVLASCSNPIVIKSLVECAKRDADATVRASALEALIKRAEPEDAEWLLKVIQSKKPILERKRAFEVLMQTTVRFRETHYGHRLIEQAIIALEISLNASQGKLFESAVLNAHQVGSAALPWLLSALERTNVSLENRLDLIASLGRIGDSSVLEKLQILMQDKSADVAEMAAKAIAMIDPSILENMDNAFAEIALAELSFKTEQYFYKYDSANAAHLTDDSANAAHLTDEEAASIESAAVSSADGLSEFRRKPSPVILRTLQLRYEGMSLKAIANKMNCHVNTVRNRMRQACDLLVANNSDHAIFIALKEGYLN